MTPLRPICIVLATLLQASAPPQPSVIARIELEKTRFLQTERIFLWTITERAKGDERPIPPAVLNNRRIIYTRPDGTTRIDQPSAPMDGMGINVPGDMGFRGGWSLRDEPPQLGRWSVVYDVGGIRSAPAEFTIEAPDALKKIEARFELSTPRVYDLDAKVMLVVSFLVPPDVLERATGQARPGISVDRLDWDSIKRFSYVSLAPGETWHVSVPLAPWLAQQFGRAGTELSFSTELRMLVGDRDGEWRGFSPLRLSASGVAEIK